MYIEEIAKEFGCKVLYSTPLRAVNLVQTDRGLVIIKETYREPDKILYIHGLKEYLYENGFTRLDRYIMSKFQLPFTIYDDRIFVMEDYIAGRECSFTNPYDREMIVRALAELHKAGKGYTPATGAYPRDNIGKWKRSCRKKIDDIIAFKKEVKAKRRKTEFDKMFLEDVDYYIEMCWRGFDTLKNSRYDEICRKAKEEKTICHHDYTYHNLIISPEGEVNVIDFDYCCHELPVYDLASLIQKVLRRYYYDIDMAMDMIDTYDSVMPLNREDLALMLSLFEFPQKFWRIVERYYKKKTDWREKEFISKYNDIVCVKDFQFDFTEEFRRYNNL